MNKGGNAEACDLGSAVRLCGKTQSSLIQRLYENTRRRLKGKVAAAAPPPPRLFCHVGAVSGVARRRLFTYSAAT